MITDESFVKRVSDISENSKTTKTVNLSNHLMLLNFWGFLASVNDNHSSSVNHCGRHYYFAYHSPPYKDLDAPDQWIRDTSSSYSHPYTL